MRRTLILTTRGIFNEGRNLGRRSFQLSVSISEAATAAAGSNPKFWAQQYNALFNEPPRRVPEWITTRPYVSLRRKHRTEL